MKILQVMDSMPQSVQQTMNVAATVGGWASLMGYVQNAAGAIAALLSVVWLSLQIWSWVSNYRKNKKG